METWNRLQFCIGVCSASSSKGDRNICLADVCEENVASESAYNPKLSQFYVRVTEIKF